MNPVSIYRTKREFIDLIQYPIITDKTTRIIEENQYCFAVQHTASKPDIKKAIEYLFEVKVRRINTLNIKNKKRRIGKFIGIKPKYKKVVVKLYDQYSINLFPDK
uniref:Large ribosomal subunit protein uL23c n=1 Tax=Gastroclonium compressum TaxID=1852973 RepID=A0A173G061_GASCM|nr:ribosomal protein L23 [Coeloseira compressa]ANH09657.1 ribosomal protein L23 [Coeloseira compressa]